jgi:hypothetical protein
MTTAINLFAPPASQQKKDILVEFKAGQMIKESSSKMVRPDKRRGLVQVKKGNDDLIHFVWKDRTTGQVEHDLILFPDDAVIRKVKEAQGRVLLLDFKTSDRKLFFWMQEPSAEKDDEYLEKMNKYFTEGAPAEEAPAGLRGLGPKGEALMRNLGAMGMDPEHLRNILQQAQAGQGAAPRPAARPAASQAPSLAPPQASETAASSAAAKQSLTADQQASMRNVLSNVLGRLGQQQGQPDSSPTLSDVVDPDAIVSSGLFDQPKVVEALSSFLPEGQVTAGNLREHVRSAQFRQAVQMFNAALRSGQLNAMLASFGLSPAPGASNVSTIEQFLAAVQHQAKEDEKKEKDTMDTSQ